MGKISKLFVVLVAVACAAVAGSPPAGAQTGRSAGCAAIDAHLDGAVYFALPTTQPLFQGERIRVEAEPGSSTATASLRLADEATGVVVVEDADATDVGALLGVEVTVPADGRYVVTWGVDDSQPATWTVSCRAARSTGCLLINSLADNTYPSFTIAETFAAGERIVVAAAVVEEGVTMVLRLIHPPSGQTLIEEIGAPPGPLELTVPSDSRWVVSWGVDGQEEATWTVGCGRVITPPTTTTTTTTSTTTTSTTSTTSTTTPAPTSSTDPSPSSTEPTCASTTTTTTVPQLVAAETTSPRQGAAASTEVIDIAPASTDTVEIATTEPTPPETELVASTEPATTEPVETGASTVDTLATTEPTMPASSTAGATETSESPLGLRRPTGWRTRQLDPCPPAPTSSAPTTSAPPTTGPTVAPTTGPAAALPPSGDAPTRPPAGSPELACPATLGATFGQLPTTGWGVTLPTVLIALALVALGAGLMALVTKTWPGVRAIREPAWGPPTTPPVGTNLREEGQRRG